MDITLKWGAPLLCACALLLSGCPRGDVAESLPPGGTNTASVPMADVANPPRGQSNTVRPATPDITDVAIGAETVPANIGANVDAVHYYSLSDQYVDVMRMASGWSSTSSDAVHGSGQPLGEIGKLDSNGWPEEDAEIMIVCCTGPSGGAADPGPESPLVGKYQISFNGLANIGDDGGTVENQHYDPATNTTTATLDQTAYGPNNVNMIMLLSFLKTQRDASSSINTGITNVRIIRPQFAPNGTKWWDSPTQEFTNPFLAALAPFSTLRFMDWTATNGSQVADWSQATPANWPTAVHMIQTDGAWQWNSTDGKMEPANGVWTDTAQSWQSVIDLANATGKDIWINIPVRATDDYVTSLATLLKSGLNPGIHVYVEYSNEVWNWGFEQWYYNNAVTTQLLAADTAAATNYQKNCDGPSTICHAAERLMQISNDFAGVWGSSAINAAIRPVFCSQMVTAGQMWIALGFINNTYGPPARYFYGICSAPYWGAPSLTAGESAGDILAASSASIPKWDGYLLSWTTAARYYGLHNFTYEGGPGTTDLQAVDTSNLVAANAYPAMGTQVTQALTGAFQNGVDMYMYYNASGAWSKYGAWGATNDVLDLTEPKWQALQTLAGKPMARTLTVTAPDPSIAVPNPGTTLPGSINAGQPLFGVVAGTLQPAYLTAGHCTAAADGLPDVCTLYSGGAQGNGEYGYLVNVPQGGTHTVTLKLDSRQAQQDATARFYVNQKPQGVITIPPSAAGTASTPAPISVMLPAGISNVELEATSGHFSVNSIVVAP